MPRSNLLPAAILFLATLATAAPSAAGHKSLARGNNVEILACGDLREGSSPTVLVIHGWGGRLDGDRFCLLAEVVRAACPASNVLIVDWTPAAGVGMPLPFRTAGNINPVAKEAAELLVGLGIEADRTTIVGESFGNYVGAKLAAALGSGTRMLIFNPASELGGYNPPDCTKIAAHSISFHTYSPYDTRKLIAHVDLFLETPAGAGHSAQHTFGVVWLAEQVRNGKLAWLECEIPLPERKSGGFCGKATLTGEVLDEAISRQPEALAAE